MKKIFLFIFLSVISYNTFAADINGVSEPEWKDFCPHAYIDVTEPKGIGKLNETAAYWYKRKTEFENAIERCREYNADDNKYTCFQQLKVKQYQKNSDYNARIEAMENSRKGPQEMYDRTDSMLPINSYLNNFSRFQPNELRGY